MHDYERIKRYLELLKEKSVISETEIHGVTFYNCDYKEAGEVPKLNERFIPFTREDYWGGKKDSHAWFHAKVVLPKKQGVYRLHIRTDRTGWDAINPQLMVYIDGKLKQGADTNHVHVYLTEDCDLMIYAYTGHGIDAPLKMLLSLQEVCEETENFLYDLWSPFMVLDYTDKETREYSDILHTINKALDIVDCREFYSEHYYTTLKEATLFFKAEFYDKLCNNKKETVTMLGHSHIDTAWLWTVRQTEEKVQRTFSTVLTLMEKYPEFQYFASQPVQYAMFKQQQPELYEKLKERVQQGRWEPEGGMWVEADCNLASGESLIRQFLFGKRFLKDEFGIESKLLWLPDVFGYNGAMPQILKKSGIETFVTAKITWNDTNRMPHDTFYWKGIDGSEILTYFITTQEKTKTPSVNYCTYVGFGEPSHVAGTYTRYTDKELTDEVLMPYGWGDGGGGPSQEFIENIRRMSHGIPNCPVSRIGRADEFFAGLHKKLATENVPIWQGELYLEFHRGTYTSMARNKRHNRKCEYKLQLAEQLSVLAMQNKGETYPQQEINDCWETVLLNQFHDILPGSSVKEVYDDTDKSYAKVHETLDTVIDTALQVLVEDANGWVGFNPHSFPYSGYVKNEEDGQFYYVDIPSKGYANLSLIEENGVCVSEGKIENEYYVLTLDEKCYITSIYDKKEKREILSEKGGLFVYEDYPYDYDAWELCDYYGRKRNEVENIRLVESFYENGRAGLCITIDYQNSVIRQKIGLYGKSRRIDFECSCDWQDEHTVLRAEFPVAVNTDKAVFDIQFGAVERSATMNNSWDMAQFEVCGHKFADYSEYNYGIALMTDCKYGYSVKNGVLSVTLLKCATYPNPDADKGLHEFTYALMPHQGDYRQAGVLQEAYRLNLPALLCKGSIREAAEKDFSLISTDSDNIIIETVKKCETDNHVIVRAYEAYNATGTAKFRFGMPVARVWLLDMMENELCEVNTSDNEWEWRFTPFAIETFKIEMMTTKEKEHFYADTEIKTKF